MGDVGAKVVGSWVFNATDSKSTLRGLTLIFEADTREADYQRVVHVTAGELHITDAALLCPRGYMYCLWTSDRATVFAKGCIFAGSEDCSVRAAAGAVVMEISRCTYVWRAPSSLSACFAMCFDAALS